MTNRGIAPIDTTTAVALVRANVGDVNYVPLVPPEVGYGDYTYFSDFEIETFITSASDDVVRATGFAYLQLAAILVAKGKSIKTDDLGIDIRSRGKDMLEVAATWFKQADALAAAEAETYFDIVPSSPRDTSEWEFC